MIRQNQLKAVREKLLMSGEIHVLHAMKESINYGRIPIMIVPWK